MMKVSIIFACLLLSFGPAWQAEAEDILPLRVPGTPLNERAAPERVEAVQFIPHLELKSGTLTINTEMINRLQDGGRLVISPMTPRSGCPNISCATYAICDQVSGYCSCYCAPSSGGGGGRGNSNRLFDAN